MSLDTIIQSGIDGPPRPFNALVLMGGGARTAYQVGVLRALASILRDQPGASGQFPFQIIIGTSAGAINAAFLASCATQGLKAFESLAGFWGDIRSSDVYRLEVSRWARSSRILAALILIRSAACSAALVTAVPEI
jgi:NTE family protein